MIEVGIPFSDPMADGIVIQNAATQALRNGMSLKLLLNNYGYSQGRKNSTCAYGIFKPNHAIRI